MPHAQESAADELALFSGQSRGPIGKLHSQRSPSFINQATLAKGISPEPPEVSINASSSMHSQSVDAPSPYPANHDLMGTDVHTSLMEFIPVLPEGASVPILTANQVPGKPFAFRAAKSLLSSATT